MTSIRENLIAARLPFGEQLGQAGILLAIIAIAFPPIFELAHWLRG